MIARSPDLPTLTDRVVIDGYSQAGALEATRNAPAQLLIVIDASAVNRGLESATDGSVVRGLVVQNALDDGIRLHGNGNRVTGSHIGTDVAGTQTAANTGDGIEIVGNHNVVGGSAPQDRNVISGNIHSGVSIEGNGNRVEGSAIGTDATMTLDLGNLFGVEVNDGNGNRVGGSASGEQRHLGKQRRRPTRGRHRDRDLLRESDRP